MFKIALIVSVFACAYAARQAVVVLDKAPIVGNVLFEETSDGVKLTGEISGLAEGKHGFHVHVVGDLRKGCASALGHFNPHKVNHGAPEDSVRHVGDLGNIVANAQGVATINFVDKKIALSGEHSIIGRAVVVHEKEDDLGKGNSTDSLITGNAGGRLTCGVIGTLSEMESGSQVAIASTILVFSALFFSIFRN